MSTYSTNNTENFSAQALPDLQESLSKYYPWLVIGFCALFLFYKYVLQISPSVMTSDLMRTFQVNGAGLGNLAAAYFYAYLVIQLFAGPLLDRYSPKFLTAFAVAVCAIGTFLFAHTSSLTMAVTARALMGAGAAFATVSYMKMSALWFPPNRVAFVDGLLATAAMAGAFCSQVPLTLLVAHTGWQHSLVYCGAFGLVLSALFLLLVKDKNKHSSSQATFQTLRLANVFSLLKNKRNWLLTFYSGLAFTPLAVLGGLWGNPFFEAAHHLTPTQAATFTSFIFLGLAIGAPFFGFLAGNFNRIKVMMSGTTLALVTLLAALYITTLPLWVFGSALFLFGLGTGSFMSCYTLGKELNSVAFAATVVALINTGDALFGSFTEPLVGKILDLFWQGEISNGVHSFSVPSFQLALALLPIYLVLALMCLKLLNKKS